MSSLSRPRNAFRGDLRFVVGIALVVASIAGVWFIVSTSDHTTPILQASRTITRGEPVRADDLQVVDVALGALEDDYLRPGDLEAGRIAARTITKGELVPASALTDEKHDNTTTVVVQSTTALPDDVKAGTEVEVWQAPALDDGRSFDAPRILVSDVAVRSVLEPQGVMAESGTEVEIVVDRSDVADVLAALTSGAALSVVPIGARS